MNNYWLFSNFEAKIDNKGTYDASMIRQLKRQINHILMKNKTIEPPWSPPSVHQRILKTLYPNMNTKTASFSVATYRFGRFRELRVFTTWLHLDEMCAISVRRKKRLKRIKSIRNYLSNILNLKKCQRRCERIKKKSVKHYIKCYINWVKIHFNHCILENRNAR